MSGVIVAGMHRSGTSLVTGVLEAGGWHPGERLLSSPAEQYREDEDFVALHRSWLGDVLPPGDGHPDWGVSSGGTIAADLDQDSWTRMGLGAADYRRTRSGQHSRWVAKDPRASLFLPVWAAHTDAHFVFVYRTPWDVVDSAIRLGHGPFCSQPRLVRDAWFDYNRRIVRMVSDDPARCTLIASEHLLTSPDLVWRALDDSVGMSGRMPARLVNRRKFVRRDGDSAIARLYRDLYPGHVDLLHQLDGLATLPRAGCPGTGGRPARDKPLRAGMLPRGRGVQVVVPCRNDGDFLAEAVASVDEVADGSVELTIVDDGSDDAETLRILDALRRSGRDVVVTRGIGLAAARNVATSRSRSCAVVPLDADNKLLPPLVSALHLVESGKADVVHGKWRQFGVLSGVVTPPEMALDNLLWTNTIDACALIRRDLLDALGGWDPALRFWEDWDLWLGATARKARVVRLDAVTFEYLVRPRSLSRTVQEDPAIHDQVVLRITKKHERWLGPTLARLTRDIHRYTRKVHSVQAELSRVTREHQDRVRRYEQQLSELSAEHRRSLRECEARIERLANRDSTLVGEGS